MSIPDSRVVPGENAARARQWAPGECRRLSGSEYREKCQRVPGSEPRGECQRVPGNGRRENVGAYLAVSTGKNAARARQWAPGECRRVPGSESRGECRRVPGNGHRENVGVCLADGTVEEL